LPAGTGEFSLHHRV